jgi:hypothetical protein
VKRKIIVKQCGIHSPFLLPIRPPSFPPSLLTFCRFQPVVVSAAARLKRDLKDLTSSCPARERGREEGREGGEGRNGPESCEPTSTKEGK